MISPTSALVIAGKRCELQLLLQKFSGYKILFDIISKNSYYISMIKA
ncbi:Uncharacterised protein [Streptococcus dysgalactiae subsp. equisimilis]|uniref:Uncharacterized protein n=1 Tax=Streptococcus dysgalactiae TaxID=1334 RepID=A0A9X9QPD6_STRDY|nr:Uncharacterised protein [Streptococcus dysgalactiae subsp. equisimilis]VTS50824.1 Uncharacterised protein [Streptococcus dysgalactiae subsp. equisimilis]VTS78613.1 Uncharacterised protein [Streptococcus dysgalactiae]